MGVQDRDWYWQERRRKERLHYNPKAFRSSPSDGVAAPRRKRPSFVAVTAIVFVLALATAPTVGRWLREHLAERNPAAASERAREAERQASQARLDQATRQQQR